MRVAAAMDDSPQLRLALAVCVALIVWAGVLFQLGHWLHTTASPRVPEKPVEMQIVELDPPEVQKASPSATPATHAVSPAIAPAKPRPTAEPRAHVPAPPRATPPVPSKPADPPTQTVAPAQPAPAAPEPNLSAQPPAHTADSPAEAAASSASSGNSSTSARAIAQPLPELPDDLRNDAYQTVAIARFLIHADGSVAVDLIKPTPNPRLNQILLEALRKWRFFPAMQTGHPVESRQDIRVHFNVN
jgi:protein TonB